MVLLGLESPHNIKSQAEDRGLCTAIVGKGTWVALILGWDSDAVEKKAGKVENELANDEVMDGERKRIMTWEENIARHQAFREQLTLDPNEFQLSNAIGTYVVGCQSLCQEGWSDNRTMTLDIREHAPEGLSATFHWGILEGIMLLAPNRTLLDELMADADPCETPEDPEPIRGRPSLGREPGDQAETVLLTAEATSPEPGESLEQEESPEPEQSPEPPLAPLKRKTSMEMPSPKRAKPGSSKRPRLDFAWRSYITKERRSQLGSDGERRGFLLFTDARCVDFMGCIVVPTLGNNVRIFGFKTSDTPTPGGRPWSQIDKTEDRPARVVRVIKLAPQDVEMQLGSL